MGTSKILKPPLPVNAFCHCNTLYAFYTVYTWTIFRMYILSFTVQMGCMKYHFTAMQLSPTPVTFSGSLLPSTRAPVLLKSKTSPLINRTARLNFVPGPTTAQNWILSWRPILPVVMTTHPAANGILCHSLAEKTKTPMTSHTWMSHMTLWSSASLSSTRLTSSFHASSSLLLQFWFSTFLQTVGRRWHFVFQFFWLLLCFCYWFRRSFHQHHWLFH